MKATAGITFVIIVLTSNILGGQPAQVGSAFSDIYAAAAPLLALHRSYADFLFYGTDVPIPDGLDLACEETGRQLANLHIDLLTQTGSQVVNTLLRLARLRADLAAFCDIHSEDLTAITRMDQSDPDLLESVSDAGLFSDIYEFQLELQLFFEAAFGSYLDPQAAWEFAVAFALNTLLGQGELLSRIEGDLEDILYGSEEAIQPPEFVPEEIAAAIVQLVQYIGVPLDESMMNEVRVLAQVIFNHVLGES
jgi:hypothetical protein